MNILGTWRFNRAAQSIASTKKYSLVHQPSFLSPAENILTFEYSPDQSPVAGTKASIRIQMIGVPPVGAIFALTNNRGDSFQSAASAAPSSGEFLRVVPNNLTNQFLTLQSLAYELSQSSFGNNYDIEVQSNVLIITAKAFGSEYTLNFTPSGFFIINSSTAGTANFLADTYTNYALYAEVYILNPYKQGSTVFNTLGSNVDRFSSEKAGEVAIPFRGENWLFNIDGYLKDYVGVVLPTKNTNFQPTVHQLDLNVDTPISRAYFLATGDNYRFVSNGEKKRFITGVTDVLYIQNSALDLLKPYSLAPYILSPIGGNPLDLLSDWSKKDTRLDSNEFIQFLLNIGAVPTSCLYGIEVTFNFVDGTNVTRSWTLGDLATYWGGNVSIDVSPRKLGVDTEEASGVWVDNYSVKVWWQEPTQPKFYSSTRKYIYKRECGEDVDSLIWFNNLGAWDSIDIKSNKVEKSFSTDQVKVTRVTPLTTPNPSYDIARVVFNNYQERVKASTFELDKSNYNFVEGLFKSTAVYLYDKSLNAFTPVLIQDSDWVQDNTGNVKTVTFSYLPTYITNTISR